jgi:predicted PurR-regulated permease PerM
MESNWVTRNTKTIWRIVLIAALAVLLYFVRRDLISTLMPFLYSAILAFLLDPLIIMLEKRGVKRVWSSLATVLLLFLLLVLFSVLFIPSLIRDLSHMLKNLTGGINNLKVMLDEVMKWLGEMIGDTVDLDSEFSKLSGQAIQLLRDMLTRLVSSLGGMVDILLVPVITFYLLKDKKSIFRAFISLFSPARKARLQLLGNEIRKLLRGYVQGKIIISAFVGLLIGLGCLLIGLPNALTIGLVVGVFDLIPYFGPWLGGTLPVLIALLGPAPIKALWVVLLILVVQQVESGLITPRVISHRVGLHPLVVMFSVMFFGAVMGIPGMVLGVPLMAVLIALIKYWRKTEAEAPQQPAQESFGQQEVIYSEEDA